MGEGDGTSWRILITHGHRGHGNTVAWRDPQVPLEGPCHPWVQGVRVMVDQGVMGPFTHPGGLLSPMGAQDPQTQPRGASSPVGTQEARVRMPGTLSGKDVGVHNIHYLLIDTGQVGTHLLHQPLLTWEQGDGCWGS